MCDQPRGHASSMNSTIASTTDETRRLGTADKLASPEPVHRWSTRKNTELVSIHVRFQACEALPSSMSRGSMGHTAGQRAKEAACIWSGSPVHVDILLVRKHRHIASPGECGRSSRCCSCRSARALPPTRVPGARDMASTRFHRFRNPGRHSFFKNILESLTYCYYR